MNTGKEKVLDWIKSLVIALILALFIRTFVVQAYKIPSGSMIPTLLIGDYLLVNKLSFGVKNPIQGGFIYFRELPKRQEVVVFTYPLDKKLDFIKRVIGLPGDTIQIVNKKVYVNGQLLYEPYVQFVDPEVYPREVSPRDNLGPIKVPQGKIFVLGDNRDQSYDSRFWGFVPIEYLKGRALIIYFSWDSEHFRIRLDRIGQVIK
ncbi:signal peptidase I [Thermodesulfobacterium sp. TA1]|uniref:signal peptidase I n=1 Tax=Thermodesulfobacterium sp. TA1 TaxID=2234087 RepID=UPI001232832F|nr:signal peptidase I [Thermodesulfobacterium sp. TA1]QER42225.1 signal peptidase I [Thermodesulfobacterium sp. TA1]